eukprot:g9319.t1
MLSAVVVTGVVVGVAALLAYRRRQKKDTSDSTPRVVFVLGGPGSGKGTQCALIAEDEALGYAHLSAGDLLRAERNSKSELADMINEFIREGKIVPAEVTVGLLRKAMEASGKSRFLIDGFPRNPDNLAAWEASAAGGSPVIFDFALFLDCPEEVMTARIMERGRSSGRIDDNEEAIRKRLVTYHESTMPIIKEFEARGKLREINSDQTIDEVAVEVRRHISTIASEFSEFSSASRPGIMLAPSASHLSTSMAGTPVGGAAASSSFSATTQTPSSRSPSSSRLVCLSFMRHSIATHNEAAATSADAMGSVYLSEAYADSSLSSRGHALVRRARQSMLGLSPAPSVVLCSPLTRAIQTAIAMFGGTGVRIVAVPEAREAYGRFPCDRHRDRSELELMFGDAVDFSLCGAKDTVWSPHHREEMSQLDGRVANFVDGVLRRETGHVFVVSHGVFIEAALRQLAFAHPGHSSKGRVHNCDVHSFVFSVSSPTSSVGSSDADAPSPSSAPASSSSSSSAAAAVAAAVPSMLGGVRHMGDPSAAAGTMAPISGGGGGRGGGTAPPQVEAYLTGQDLALACATGMPLPAVARVNRAIRRCSSGDGLGLTERQFSALLGRCGLGTQETRWLFCALDREGGGTVASGDLLLALVAFYSGAGGADAPGGAGARVGLMDLRARYQREMYGTPLANYELLDAAFKRILLTLLATS